MNDRTETNESSGGAGPSTPTIRCSVCLGTNVQHHDWVDSNTNTVAGGLDSDFSDLASMGMTHCAECDESTELETIPDDEREVLGDLLELEQRKILQRLPGGQWQLAAGGKSHPRTWGASVVRGLCYDAFNSAIKEIQDALGVDDGGFASVHWDGLFGEEVQALLYKYAAAEISNLPGPGFGNGDRVQFTKDATLTLDRTEITVPAMSTGTVIESNSDCLGIVLDEPAVVGPRGGFARKAMMSGSESGADGEVWFHENERDENTSHITVLEEA